MDLITHTHGPEPQRQRCLRRSCFRFRFISSCASCFYSSFPLIFHLCSSRFFSLYFLSVLPLFFFPCNFSRFLLLSFHVSSLFFSFKFPSSFLFLFPLHVSFPFHFTLLSLVSTSLRFRSVSSLRYTSFCPGLLQLQLHLYLSYRLTVQ